MTAAEIRDRASRGALWTAVQAVVSLPLSVLGTVVLARLLSIDDYGRLAYLTVVLVLLATVSDLGFTASAVQWGSGARAEGDLSGLRGTLGRVTGFHLYVQGPIVLVGSVLLLQREGLLAACGYAILGYGVLYVSGASLALVLDQRNDQLAKIALVNNAVLQLLTIGAAVWTRDILVVLLVRLGMQAAAGLAALLWLSKRDRKAVLVPRRPLPLPAGAVKFGIYSWGAGLIGLLVYSRSEILLLEHLGTARDLAVFALAFGIASQLTGPLDAALAPFVPAAAALAAADPRRLPQAATRALRIASLASGFLCVAALPVVITVLPFAFGTRFDGVGSALLVLGLTSAFQSASGPLAQIVAASRRGRALLVAASCGLVVDLCLAVWLIPGNGVRGAVIANAAAQITVIAVLVFQVRGAFPGFGAHEVLVGTLAYWVAVPLAIVAGVVAVGQVFWLGLLASCVATVAFLLLIRGGGMRLLRSDVDAMVGKLPAVVRRPIVYVLAFD